MFDSIKFNEMIITNKIIGFFDKPIILKSGRQSYWYVNCRDLSNTYSLLDKTSSFVIDFLNDLDIEVDYVYGVPEGASKLAVIVNYKLGLQNKKPLQKIIIGRGQPKTHGAPKDKYFIGDIAEQDRVIVLEDVTTTGGSLLSTISQLREAKVNIVAAVGLVNRMEKRDDGRSVEQAISEKGIPYYSLGNSLALLPIAAKA